MKVKVAAKKNVKTTGSLKKKDLTSKKMSKEEPVKSLKNLKRQGKKPWKKQENKNEDEISDFEEVEDQPEKIQVVLKNY